VRLKKYTLLSARTFFQLKCIINLGTPGHNSVPGNALCFFNHSDGMLLHIMGIRSTSSFSHLDVVLFSVFTFYLFCHNDGSLLHTMILSNGGYAFVQVHKNLKYIYLTFGYVGVAHWAAIDAKHSQPRRKR